MGMPMNAKFGSTVKDVSENEGFGIGLVRSRSFGRKRVICSNTMEVGDYSLVINPTKKQCCENPFPALVKSPLEALPQDILIRILCGVEHDDLNRLFHVSKSIKEAALIAKQWHFAYSTPTKAIGFRNSLDFDDSSEFDEVEAPNAPRQYRIPKTRLSAKKLADISVALFASLAEDEWPSRQLFMEREREI